MKIMLDVVWVASIVSTVLAFIVLYCNYGVRWRFSKNCKFGLAIAPKGGIVITKAEASEVWVVDSGLDNSVYVPFWVKFLFTHELLQDGGDPYLNDVIFGEWDKTSKLYLLSIGHRLTIMNGELWAFANDHGNNLLECHGTCIMTAPNLSKYIKVA